MLKHPVTWVTIGAACIAFLHVRPMCPHPMWEVLGIGIPTMLLAVFCHMKWHRNPAGRFG